ncbi:glutathione S-transferase [Boletus edulis BED1]|uniref:glutathione transferase n=1 Tax=Boletus edulis BED1 TaxID=1328754 RepID=A0AAD4BLL7_BOLED|nr:glutathione S-transferase [Boletus edulis BED1]KAF8440075.1 glutathione S-transferase [Boletus edulis BED1]
MVLKLYGYPSSTCTLRVAVVLKEKNVPFEFHMVDLAKGEHKAPGFVAQQPFGQVPYIDDDGLILFESRAIARYIATKYASQGDALIPTDLKKLALFERAASIEAFNYDPFVSGLAWELKFKAWFGGKTDEAHVKALHDQLKAKLDAYEVILAKQKYLAGDEVTLADLFHLPYGSILLADDIKIDEFSSRPNVARWWKDITSRASWQAVKGGIA